MNVKIVTPLGRCADGSMNCEVETESGVKYKVDNLHLIQETYQGNVKELNEDGSESSGRICQLTINGDHEGILIEG